MTVDLHRFDPPDGLSTGDIRMGCVDCGKVNPGPLHCCCYQFFKKPLEQQIAENQPKPTQPKPNAEPSNSHFQSWPFLPTPKTSDCSIPENSPGFQEWLRTHRRPDTELYKYIPPVPNGYASIPENSPGFQEWRRTHVSVEPTPFPTIYDSKPPKK